MHAAIIRATKPAATGPSPVRDPGAVAARRTSPCCEPGAKADVLRPRPRPERSRRHAAAGDVAARKAAAEAIGTGLLVAAVIGSGIAAQRLSPDQIGLQLLENSLATGFALAALIVALQPVSAAFNPVVTLAERALSARSPPGGRRPDRRADWSAAWSGRWSRT